MFTLKQVVVFFILENIISSFCFYKGLCFAPLDNSKFKDTDDSSDNDGPQYWDENTENNLNEDLDNNLNEDLDNNLNDNSENNFNKYPENKFIENSENNFSKICPEEEHSLISHSDIKYLIEEKADILQIRENIRNSYYSVAEEILKKYMGELEEFQDKINDRPEHMLHILHDMARFRQKLEPDVEETATLLEHFHTLEDNINNVVKNSANKLNKLEKYKNICKINCEEIGVENRFGHNLDNNPFNGSQSAGMYCVRVKDLNENINKKLSEVQAQYDEDLNQQLKIRDRMYAQKITELKINLKEAAVKQFGMTMYDILSLEDDYHHFIKDFKHANISSETYNIQENVAEIGFKGIGLHRDLEKYRQYCMKCNMDQRVKRNIFDMLDGRLFILKQSSVIPTEKITDAETNYLDELIKAKIDEIRESIESNFTSLFEELDEKLNDPDVIDVYVTQLHPIQNEIGQDIKTEQEALRRLITRIPEASIDKILALSKESKQIIENLESAKQFMDQIIS